jgi:hypothetical protein
VASSTGTTPHTLELRAIQDGDNAEPRKVSQFKLDMTNVVTAQVNSQLLVFLTDNSVRVLEAKVRTVSDQLIDLVPTIQANAFSLANLPVGVYTLDIITQKGNAKAAYEGILVISQQPTTIINETIKQVINQEINQNSRVDIDTKIIFKEKDKPKQKPRSNNPYCDLIPDNYAGSCHDRKDYDENTGLYPCRDGSNVKDWRDCKDAGKHPDEKKRPEQRICTMGMDAGSLACKEGITVEQYCAKNPQTQGCPGAEVGLVPEPVPLRELFCESPNNPPGCRPLETTPSPQPQPQQEPEPPVQEPLPPCDSVPAGTTCDDTASEDSTLDEPVEEFPEEEVGEGIEEPFVIEDIEEEPEEEPGDGDGGDGGGDDEPTE